MEDITTHFVFLVVSGVSAVFLFVMRVRLRTAYPDDDSPQMQSMQRFMRGMLVLAAVVFLLVLVDAVRVMVTR